MLYLKRTNLRPNTHDLNAGEIQFLQQHFDPYSNEVVVAGQTVRWNEIEEVEIVLSPRAAGPAGWIVRNLVHGNERYHVGLYFGRQEAVVPNVTLKVARYITQCIAYYSPLPVRFTGPEGLSPLIEE